eukprot:Lankesteria_metandrocarpae@DN2342_c0_g1_i1.p1
MMAHTGNPTMMTHTGNQSMMSHPSSQLMSPSSQYERRISSTILQEEFLEKVEPETVRYVEVPEYVEVPKYITKRSVVEVEKRVPKYEIEYVEKIVEVPQIEYVEKIVEVPQVNEVVRTSTKKEVIQVPKETVREVKRIETRIIEKIVEVPGEIIEVPKPYVVENKIEVPYYVDTNRHVVVAQSVHPFVQDSPEDVIEVDVHDHSPEVIEVEVQVPKPVSAQVWCEGSSSQYHKVIKNLPAAQFNSLLKLMNPHLVDDKVLPFMSDNEGSMAMLPSYDSYPCVELKENSRVVDDDGTVYVVNDERSAIDAIAHVAMRKVSDIKSVQSREIILHDEESTMSTHSSLKQEERKVTGRSMKSAATARSHRSKKSKADTNITKKEFSYVSRTSVAPSYVQKRSRVCAC